MSNNSELQGRIPIHIAAVRGHVEIVKALIGYINNPTVPDNYGETPIHCAARYGHTEVIKILIKCTENPNTIDKNGNTPIHTAANFGHREIVKILLGCTDAKIMKTKREWISVIQSILFLQQTTTCRKHIKEFVNDL